MGVYDWFKDLEDQISLDDYDDFTPTEGENWEGIKIDFDNSSNLQIQSKDWLTSNLVKVDLNSR